jgi:site-specific DNA-methyltransferase (adenine-specific)
VKVEIGDAVLYLGDCLEILPTLPKVDAVITDPPYEGYDYPWPVPDIRALPLPDVRQFIFWPGNQEFPLPFSARHIWSKCNVCIGDAEPYEAIYERNGKATGLVFRHAVINCEMNATLNGDEYTKHPTQKPIRLMRSLVSKVAGAVADPFMGSGSTGVAALLLGRRFYGIEQSEEYFDIACRRIEQAYAQGKLFQEPPPKQEQAALI